MKQPSNPLTISARNAGQVELKKYCPRCCWYLLRIKKMPFQFGMPGLMFYMEQVEKAFITAYLNKAESLPKHLKPFSRCTGSVEFPSVMHHFHEETGVIVSARPDMILSNPDGSLTLIDLKTSKPDGGGKEFLPQYQIQVIGYSWVANAERIGNVTAAGLIYGDIQVDSFVRDPLKLQSGEGFNVPFALSSHDVPLDYKRLTRCLTEVNKVWNAERPPKGVVGCKDCKLLTRFVDFENNLQLTDLRLDAAFPDYHLIRIQQDFDRRRTRPLPMEIEDLLSEDHWDEEGGMWSNWEF
jgi:hypothetical protein